MSLRTKSFYLNKDSSLQPITDFILVEIGLNSFLIKDLQASLKNNNIIEYTLFYNKYPESIVDSFAPREGVVLNSDSISSSLDIRILFNCPIDPSSITSGTFSIDNVGLDTGRVYVDPDSKNYIVKLNTSGNFQTQSYHTYKIHNTLRLSDGSSFPYNTLGGYTIHNSLPHTYLGDYSSEIRTKRRGTVTAGYIKLHNNQNIQQGILEYLFLSNITSEDRVLTASVIDDGPIRIVYFLYLSSVEPQIVNGYPLNNSILSNVSYPDTFTFSFNTELDRGTLTGTSNLFTIESDFSTSTSISTNHITLLEDNKTVEIDISSYISNQSVYTIIARPGIKSLYNNVIKIKPDQWSFQIIDYAGSSITGDYITSNTFANHTGNASIHYTQSEISITESQISDLQQYITSGTITGHSHFIAYSGAPPTYYQRPGMSWFDTSSSRYFIWYVDSDSSQWIEL